MEGLVYVQLKTNVVIVKMYFYSIILSLTVASSSICILRSGIFMGECDCSIGTSLDVLSRESTGL